MKKAAQKLLFVWARGGEASTAQRKKKFFASFFQKRSPFLLGDPAIGIL
ncbi:MAG TPA: hypothetical protein VL356_14395 [Acidocella sp.]|nr:hypothetical protein [Acidocella sp.]